MNADSTGVCAGLPVGFMRPRILRGEWDVGYFGRIGRLNGCSSKKAARNLVRSISDHLQEPCPTDLLAQLAGVADIEMGRLLRDHGLEPLRFIAANLTDRSDAELRQVSDGGWGTRVFGLLTSARPRLCVKCVDRDLTRLGLSIWRRSHQLPGLLWCPVHKESLVQCADRSAFLDCPSDRLGGGEKISEKAARTWCEDPCAQSFLALLERRLWSGRPIQHSVSYAPLLEYQRALNRQRQPRHDELRHVLLGPLKDAYPRGWLRQVLPQAWWDETQAAASRAAPSCDKQLMWVLLCAMRCDFRRAPGTSPEFTEIEWRTRRLGACRPTHAQAQKAVQVDSVRGSRSS